MGSRNGQARIPQRGRSLIVRGRANLLDDPRIRREDLDRVRGLFAELETSENLLNVLDTARDAAGVRLFIGSENPLFSLSGSAMIVAPYMDAEPQDRGSAGRDRADAAELCARHSQWWTIRRRSSAAFSVKRRHRDKGKERVERDERQ
jgi:hypothetical protein